MSLAAAMQSLARVLDGIPGVFVSVRGNAIVVYVNEDSTEDDRNNLKRLARMGWEKFKVRIEGMT